MATLLDHPMDHASVLERMKHWGIRFDAFFDVGAARGEFGAQVRRHWPDSALFFFEAAVHWAEALEKTRRELAGETYIELAAVGEADGQEYFRFDAANPRGGGLVDNPSLATDSVPVVALDSYIARRDIQGPLALKLDVHGAEQAILAGARNFMSRCELIIFETYNFGPSHRRFGQMAVLLEDQFGMRCVDIAEPKWRPYDGALWQMDFYFARYEGTTLAEWRL